VTTITAVLTTEVLITSRRRRYRLPVAAYEPRDTRPGVSSRRDADGGLLATTYDDRRRKIDDNQRQRLHGTRLPLIRHVETDREITRLARTPRSSYDVHIYVAETMITVNVDRKS